MISQIAVSSDIYESIYKAIETLRNENEEARKWITDIVENRNRPEYDECEICQSSRQLEQHHVRGRKHGNACITVCLECHTELTNRQRLWDKSWLNPDTENKDAFLVRGLIDICELKCKKTGKEIYRQIADKLTEGFTYD